ncbi:hypothetical protein CONPUDRAFT_167028 [Coniophora puteana RWD-64-598 SS2]|uniref:Mid2 domain-containing protein n=1 Tax=Coniophora puteana (strain RWD-64-598) TaxID=741705 RepID=A0A5M3MJR4_CONPW|nr:uncharacterized protein CONPUDRAFT_167028 [Coniophora puteana RWD-64-598 SS2]EIW79247.1 hypothetical protein CONPUDRAFT_167028 [Coniophora puteana RWD-64-598 SS2]
MKRTRNLLLAAAAATALGSSFEFAAAQGNVTCASNTTDWYHDLVGETPCMTYWRLRSICNPQYEVPTFRPNTPGDNCDDQLADCCCNSVAWALSMLCMNCQLGTPQAPNGIDAGKGAYEIYMSNGIQECTPNVNQTLPGSIQPATCNKGLKLPNFLYTLFWVTGDWYYVYTMDTAVASVASAGSNKSSLFTAQGCPTVSPNISVSAGPSSPTSGTSTNGPLVSGDTSSSSSSGSSDTATTVGATIGGIAALVGLIGIGVYVSKTRKGWKSTVMSLSASKKSRGRYPAYGDSSSTTTDLDPFSAEPRYPPPQRSPSSTWSPPRSAHGYSSSVSMTERTYPNQLTEYAANTGFDRSSSYTHGSSGSNTNGEPFEFDRRPPSVYTSSAVQSEYGARSTFSQSIFSHGGGDAASPIHGRGGGAPPPPPPSEVSQRPTSYAPSSPLSPVPPASPRSPRVRGKGRMVSVPVLREEDSGPLNEGLETLPPSYNPAWQGSVGSHSSETQSIQRPRGAPRLLPPTPGPQGGVSLRDVKRGS